MAGHLEAYRERALRVVRARGIARAQDFKAAGIPLVYLKRMTDAGDLVRLGRGLYQDSERAGEDVAHDLAEAARIVPNGVISLVSALRHHELTTQLPNAVWMTIPHKARRRCRRHRRRLHGQPRPAARVAPGRTQPGGRRSEYPGGGVARTVTGDGGAAGAGQVDLMVKLQHVRTGGRHVGEDLAIEALRDALRQKKTTPCELRRFAVIDRVVRRIEPLLKAMQ